MTETRVEQLLAVISKLHDKIDGLEAELSEYRSENERDKADVKRRISDIEGGETGKSDSEPGVNADETLLPIERLSKYGEESDLGRLGGVTESVERAVTIFDHFNEWSRKAPAGRTIRANLKTLLVTATGEKLAWKQVYRACRKLEEWSKGAIRFKKHSRHGWMLIRERASSASAR